MHNAYRLVQTVLGPCPHIAPTVYAAGFMRTFLQTFSAADFYTCSRQAPYSAGLSRPDVTPEPARYNINRNQPESAAYHPEGTANLYRQAVPPVYPVGSARLFICADRCLAHSRAKPDTLASHCIHYAMSTRFSLPFMGRCKNFCSIIGSFLSFRHNVQLLLPGLNVYPSCISENVSRISHPSVLSATEMPKHLRPVSAL